MQIAFTWSSEDFTQKTGQVIYNFHSPNGLLHLIAFGKCMGECSNSEGGDSISDFLVWQFFLEVQWVFCPSYEVILEYNVIWILVHFIFVAMKKINAGRFLP